MEFTLGLEDHVVRILEPLAFTHTNSLTDLHLENSVGRDVGKEQEAAGLASNRSLHPSELVGNSSLLGILRNKPIKGLGHRRDLRGASFVSSP